ncbi:Serine/threonine-protein kinase hippo [Pelomyxa schiedti]|nr:Serine/threonine-protein kinase hippo [Pelomyxa schiedti]
MTTSNQTHPKPAAQYTQQPPITPIYNPPVGTSTIATRTTISDGGSGTNSLLPGQNNRRVTNQQQIGNEMQQHVSAVIPGSTTHNAASASAYNTICLCPSGDSEGSLNTARRLAANAENELSQTDTAAISQQSALPHSISVPSSPRDMTLRLLPSNTSSPNFQTGTQCVSADNPGASSTMHNPRNRCQDSSAPTLHRSRSLSVTPHNDDATSPRDPAGPDEGSILSPEEFFHPERSFLFSSKLGEGSFGSVWKAIHRTGRSFAIKKVIIEDNLGELSKEVEFMRSLKSEWIVRYFGSCTVNGEFWIIMEFCGAGSLRAVMKNCQRTLNEREIAISVNHILHGLNYLHGIRKLHRDIKAGNVLVNENGVCKLSDFGVSGQLTDAHCRRHTMIGTPFWMAPEVIQDTGYDEHADIWSLGITCIELAEGQPPHFEESPIKAIFCIPNWDIPVLKERDSWTPTFHNFLSRLLVKNPDCRPLTGELLEDPFVKDLATETLSDLVSEQQQAVLLQLASNHDNEEVNSKENSLKLNTASESDSEYETGDFTDDITPRMCNSSMSLLSGGFSDSLSPQGTMLAPLPRGYRPKGNPACPNCESLKQDRDILRAEVLILRDKVSKLEAQLDKTNSELLQASSEANLYKGQVLVFEKLFKSSS